MLDLNEVLALVNVGRIKLDLPPLTELPKGLVGACNECVLARCFPGSYVTAHSLRYDQPAPDLWGYGMYGEWHVTLPDVLMRFIRQFDCYGYPELLDVDPKDLHFIYDHENDDVSWQWSTYHVSRWFACEEDAIADMARKLPKSAVDAFRARLST